MSRDIPSDDSEFVAELRKFIAAAKLKPAAYGVTVAEVTDLEEKTDALEAAQNAEDSSQMAYRAAVKLTGDVRVPTESAFRPLRADAYDNADDAQLIEAGLEPRKKPSKTAPTPPLNLRVTGGADGINALQWEMGDNSASTDYVLYARDSATEPWQMFDIVGTLRAKQAGQTVGKMKFYQVTARRRKIESEPSNVAVVFGSG